MPARQEVSLAATQGLKKPTDKLEKSVNPLSTEDLLNIGSDKKFCAENKLRYPVKEKISVETQDTFHLMIIGNLFYGTPSCDVETFEKHLKIAQSLDNVKVLLLGNLISNKRTTDVIPPDEQVSYVKGWIDRLGSEGKILAAVRSDYPKNLKKDIDNGYRLADVNDELFENANFPIFQNGGIMELEVKDASEDKDKAPKQTYKIGLFSNGGTARKLLVDSAGQVDVLVVGSKTIAESTETLLAQPPHRKDAAMVTVGGYSGNGEDPNLLDQNLRDKRGKDASPGGQVLTLHTDAKEAKSYLRAEEFVYDYFVDAFDRETSNIDNAGKTTEYLDYLKKERGIIFSRDFDTPAEKDHRNNLKKLIIEEGIKKAKQRSFYEQL